MIKECRIEYLDIAKGICMLCVVYVHVFAEYPIFSGIPLLANDYIMSFFMPAFFIFSGILIKKSAWKDFRTKKSKSLLRPLIVFYCLGFLFSLFLSKASNVALHNEFSWFSFFNIFLSKTFSNGALWFLLALFWGLVLFQFFLHISSVFKRAAFAMTILAIFLAWKIFLPFRMPMYIDSGIYSWIYLYVGLRIRPLLTYMKYSRILMILSFVLSALFVFFFRENKSSMMTAMYNGNLVLSLLTGIMGAIMLLSLSMMINKNMALSYFGKYSIVVLCTHLFFIKPVVMLLTKFMAFPNFIMLPIVYLVVVFLCYLGIHIIISYCPFIIGKEKVCKECV